jgi:hypothetical protein
MPGGKRPGGLTALAVLNFVFGGLGALFMLLAIGGLMLLAKGASDLSDGQVKVSEAPGIGMIYLWIALSVVQVILMIASGVGYLKLKKFLGKTLGNVYALVSIAGSIVSAVLLHQGFGIGTIIGLVYPVLTIILLNTAFKDEFVN